MIANTENFYFDIAIHDEVIYRNYYYGKYSLSEMAESAYTSEVWDSLKNLTPVNLDKQIAYEEEVLNALEDDYDKTGLIRISTFGATVVHLAALITSLIAMLSSQNYLAVATFFGLLLLGALIIPTAHNSGKQIAILRREMLNQEETVVFLHLARKELIDTITRHES